ncbi:unnamed protein product, partial [Staurois parvus]
FPAGTQQSPCKPDREETCQHGHAQKDTKQHASLVKQHTFNPLIAQKLTPFLPSVISIVSVLFISTDHCISVTGDVSGS